MSTPPFAIDREADPIDFGRRAISPADDSTERTRTAISPVARAIPRPSRANDRAWRPVPSTLASFLALFGRS
jgi:hypothetical protein